jgi:hypothetical protein
MWITNKLNLFFFMCYVLIGSVAHDTFQVEAEPNPNVYLAARALAESFAQVLSNAVKMYVKPEGFDGSQRVASTGGLPTDQGASGTASGSRCGGLAPDVQDSVLESLKSKGLVCLPGKKLALANFLYPKKVKITKPDGKEHHLCFNHMFLGRACHYGEDACTHLHLMHTDHLSLTTREPSGNG